MVFLHQISSRKRSPPSPSSTPKSPPKTSKPTTTTAATTTTTTTTTSGRIITDPNEEKMLSLLAEAGCTLVNHNPTPTLPSDTHKFRHNLHHRFSSSTSPSLITTFLTGLTSYIRTPSNLKRVLLPAPRDSLLRLLLLIPPLQLPLQTLLLEKLPEHFQSSEPKSLEDDLARLIINHFRFLDFLVDPKSFTDKLLELLSICPLHLQKEIIGSLPEIIGDQSNIEDVVTFLQQLLQEDSSKLIVPVLDSFSNLNLDGQMQEQVVTTALSCIRTVDAEDMPYLLRFLLLSATNVNARRIIAQIRRQVKFVGALDSRARAKGKSRVNNSEISVLEALRSSLRFKNILCQEILNELKSIDKAKDHMIIDVWLLMLIYMNSGTLQKTVEKILKRKIIEDCLPEALFDQCIHGHRELVQEYFPSFLSVSEYLVGCKEQKARVYGIHLYTSLFGEFTDTYSRQEILGALVTHIGSGIGYEVSSALETMVLLASKHLQELIPLSSYITGILDYLEGFNVENLNKVYEVFGHLALSARSTADSVRSSIANELLMIVRKQVSNPDLKYKKMGLIGTLKIVACLGNINNANGLSSSQKTNCEESLELLIACLDSCKLSPLPRILFYDELSTLLESTSLQPAIMEWIGKHVGDFESIFLSDLEGGKLLSKDSYCGLDGELWMNLDGELSPICLNILPLISSSLESSSSLQILPAYFHLLSVVERLTNQGSLGGIDALLGCPLYLPSSKYFVGALWSSLTGKQKQAMCLSLYYATNWLRTLLNAFCTQVVGKNHCTSQATREDIISKLLNRLRNLVFLESLLNTSLKLHPLSLPDLHLIADHSGYYMEKKNEKTKVSESKSSDKKLKRKRSIVSETPDDRKMRQPTILDLLRKSGAVSQEVQHEGSSHLSCKGTTSQQPDSNINGSNESGFAEISASSKALDAQRFKCRPLSVDCLSILSFSKVQGSCCSDPSAELPLHLHLLRDLYHKLDYLSPMTKRLPAGYSKDICSMSASEFLIQIRILFPSLKKHLDCAVCVLKDGSGMCPEHWGTQSASAGIPDIAGLVVLNSSVASSVFREILSCFSKMLNLLDIQMDTPVLSDLLQAFQPMKVPGNLFSGMQPIPSPGNIDYLYCGAFSFMESVLDTACSFSVVLASEVLVTLKSIVTSAESFLTKFLKGKGNGKSVQIGFVEKVLPNLRKKLGTSAKKLLMQNWDHDNIENGGKNKGETIQRILHIYLENSEETADLLEDFACSILPQVPSCKNSSTEEAVQGFPTLCATTFVIWYRVLYEENQVIINKLVKEVISLEKHKVDGQNERVKKLLIKLHQSVNVAVSLVNMCRYHDKVMIHAMAVKHGGKFVDSFLKAFDFLEAHFQVDSEMIIQLVKELQKATRIIQTLCSEAKGSKRTMITTKIPATKRTLERFLFRVKALLHNTASGCKFWMGNLKHKDLLGQVVSSQLYADENDDNDDEEAQESEEGGLEEQPDGSILSGGETE